MPHSVRYCLSKIAERELTARDDLALVADIRTSQIHKLQAAGITTAAQLAAAGAAHVARLNDATLEKLQLQACLQIASRGLKAPAWKLLTGPAAFPCFRLRRLGTFIGASRRSDGSRSAAAWIACIADAQPVVSYEAYLTQAGLRVDCTENHDAALVEMVNQVRMRLLGAEIAVGLKKIELPGVDFVSAKRMAQSALEAVRTGSLGYAIIHATRT